MVQLGRVESDPLRIPTAASMGTGRSDAFERALQDAVAADEARPDAAAPRDAAAEAPASETQAADAQREPPAATERPERDTGDDAEDAAARTTTTHAFEDAGDVTESMRRGESERQATAGKGTDSPRTSTAAGAAGTAELPLAGAPRAALQPAGVPVGVVVAEAAARSTGTAGGGEPTVRGIDGPAFRAAGPTRAAAAQAAYSTRSAASAELLEQARDSVFKQVLMKLTGEGGELRMRLEPPTLGELDLRLVVEGGNKLSLAIAAERPEVAALLQRHLDELKHTLQQSGLEITGAEVQTRGEFAREREAGAGGDGSQHRTDDDAPRDDFARRPRTGGWVSAEGLDFWA